MSDYVIIGRKVNAFKDFVTVSNQAYDREEFGEQLSQLTAYGTWLPFCDKMKRGDVYYEFLWRVLVTRKTPVGQTQTYENEPIPHEVLNQILRRKFF